MYEQLSIYVSSHVLLPGRRTLRQHSGPPSPPLPLRRRIGHRAQGGGGTLMSVQQRYTVSTWCGRVVPAPRHMVRAPADTRPARPVRQLAAPGWDVAHTSLAVSCSYPTVCYVPADWIYCDSDRVAGRWSGVMTEGGSGRRWWRRGGGGGGSGGGAEGGADRPALGDDG